MKTPAELRASNAAWRKKQEDEKWRVWHADFMRQYFSMIDAQQAVARANFEPKRQRITNEWKKKWGLPA